MIATYFEIVLDTLMSLIDYFVLTFNSLGALEVYAGFIVVFTGFTLVIAPHLGHGIGSDSVVATIPKQKNANSSRTETSQGRRKQDE